MMEVAILTLLIWIFTSEITPASISSFILAVTALFTIVTAFVNWRIDRKRLRVLENDRDIMREDFEKHKDETIDTFREIRQNINESNSDMVDKIIRSNNEMNDNIKGWMKLVIHSNINERGRNEKDGE